MRSFAVICLAAIGFSALSFSVAAQQKTVKTCQAEWRANEAANKAKGITEKAYVAQCRAGGAAQAAPAAATTKKETAAPASTTSSSTHAAAQKSARTCRAEWRANEAANKAKGITEKAYVAQCRAGGGAAAAAPAAPAAEKKAAAPTSATSSSTRAAAQRKTVKECQAEWRANEAANKAKGVTEKAYVAQCRAGGGAAEAAPAAPAPSEATTSPAPAAPAARASRRSTTTASTAPTGANEYSTEAQAKARCGTGTVVWADLKSKIFHFSGYRYYGHTKSGAYMCEHDATEQGMRAAKNEKHP